jgi:hypothetical protein
MKVSVSGRSMPCKHRVSSVWALSVIPCIDRVKSRCHGAPSEPLREQNKGDSEALRAAGQGILFGTNSDEARKADNKAYVAGDCME